MYAFADVGGTYSQGKSIAALDADASATGTTLTSALGAVTLGALQGGGESRTTAGMPI